MDFPLWEMKITWSLNYSKIETANVNIVGKAFVPYFYFYVPFIHELAFFIPFTPFEANFFMTINVASSYITPNAWGMLRDF